ncbi:EthD domain-containing protein [Gordonia polyisoprenivorans]|uniref:EthD domain-containing protein n=1 Tax=Gordonia polyisoprenivorans TaxID=84595 RepID=UPI00230088B6|nr:EthD domain-containing protein [Gordonia polyisoprenivorans]WCB36901.1 EthD domain-containing protein [Gordonia polyisoprenivorans]
MSNVSRHRPNDTLEWFYNEWHGEHVDIMRRSPGVMKLVRRYVQNPALHDPGLPTPPLPLGPEGWDAMSQLTFDGIQEFIDCFSDPDYVANVRGHLLSDPDHVVTVLTDAEIVTDGGVDDSAVKAAIFYQLRDTTTAHAFESAWTGEYTTQITDNSPIIRHVRNRVAGSVSPEVFVDTRWENVPMNEFTCYDELWFANRSDLADFLADVQIRTATDQLRDAHLTPRSFTYLCRERVAIDSLTPLAR